MAKEGKSHSLRNLCALERGGVQLSERRGDRRWEGQVKRKTQCRDVDTFAIDAVHPFKCEVHDELGIAGYVSCVRCPLEPDWRAHLLCAG